MKLIAISEHYFPRVGGTVNYVHQTLTALAGLGVTIELWVPGPPPQTLPLMDMAPRLYKVVWIDAGYPTDGNPTRRQRYAFCAAANQMAQQRAVEPGSPDIVHVLFGLFLMETLDTGSLHRAGVRSVATVHNVPPQECRLTGPQSSLTARALESWRLRLVGWKNRERLHANPFDLLVVPSVHVRNLLGQVLTTQAIIVIGHGPTGELLARMAPPATRDPARSPTRILSAGGYAPHKRQHLIPEVAARLSDEGLPFEWDVVGPRGRIAGYFEAVSQQVRSAGLECKVRIHPAVPLNELAALYDAAHLYVQPSTEEGFCMTALDAAASGLPVIASPTGALSCIAKASRGCVVASDVALLSDAIAAFIRDGRWGDAGVQSRLVLAQFSWTESARLLRDQYDLLRR